MPSKYLITGLPRSRTAWMAAFMECAHEPTAQMDTLFDIESFYEENEGCSDSGMGWWLPWISRQIKPRILIIVRPIADVEESLFREFPELPRTNYCAKLAEALLPLRYAPGVMTVSFSALSDIATMRRVFWHLRPGVPFDEGRYLEMNKKRIVVGKDVVKNLTGKLLLRPHEGVKLCR